MGIFVCAVLFRLRNCASSNASHDNTVSFRLIFLQNDDMKGNNGNFELIFSLFAFGAAFACVLYFIARAAATK